MTNQKISKEFLQGVPELLVLRLLSDREMYGYEIVRSIRLHSNEKIQFGEGLIYPLLHALQKRRLVAIRKETINGRQRIYYRLTEGGKKKLREKISNWERVVGAIQLILDGGSNEVSST